MVYEIPFPNEIAGNSLIPNTHSAPIGLAIGKADVAETRAGEHVGGRHVTGGDMRPDHVVEFDVPLGVRRVCWRGVQTFPAKHLFARPGLHEPLIETGVPH